MTSEMRKVEEKLYGDRIKETLFEGDGLKVEVTYGLKDNSWIPFSLWVYDPATKKYTGGAIYDGPRLSEWEMEYFLQIGEERERRITKALKQTFWGSVPHGTLE